MIYSVTDKHFLKHTSAERAKVRAEKARVRQEKRLVREKKRQEQLEKQRLAVEAREMEVQARQVMQQMFQQHPVAVQCHMIDYKYENTFRYLKKVVRGTFQSKCYSNEALTLIAQYKQELMHCGLTKEQATLRFHKKIYER